MKRILVYGSLSVLTAVGTVFAAANAEIFNGEDSEPQETSQLTDGIFGDQAIGNETFGITNSSNRLNRLNGLTDKTSKSRPETPLKASPESALSALKSNEDIQTVAISSNGAIRAVQTGVAQPNSFISQVPGTTMPGTTPMPKPSASELSEPDEDADAITPESTDSSGVESVSPSPGVPPLSPVPGNSVVPASPTDAPLGSPVLPAAPGGAPTTIPLDTEAADDIDEETLEAVPTEVDEDSLESDSFDAAPAVEPLTDEPPAGEGLEDGLEMEGDLGIEEDVPLEDGPSMTEEPPTEDEAGVEDEPDIEVEAEVEDDFEIESEPVMEDDSAMEDDTELEDDTDADESLLEDSTPLPGPPGSEFTPGAPDNGGITPSAPDSNFTPAVPEGVTPLTPDDAPPVESPSPALPPAPLEPMPEAPTEALPPINDSGFDEGTQPLGSTSDRLIGEGFTPFQLSYLAIGGGLKEVGIPGGNLLLSAYESGDISAADIVAAGARTKRLGTAADDEADYTKGVDKFLKLLSRESLNS